MNERGRRSNWRHDLGRSLILASPIREVNALEIPTEPIRVCTSIVGEMIKYQVCLITLLLCGLLFNSSAPRWER